MFTQDKISETGICKKKSYLLKNVLNLSNNSVYSQKLNIINHKARYYEKN